MTTTTTNKVKCGGRERDGKMERQQKKWNQGFGFIIATLGIIGNLCVSLKLSGIECYVQRDGTTNKEARLFIE